MWVFEALFPSVFNIPRSCYGFVYGLGVCEVSVCWMFVCVCGRGRGGCIFGVCGCLCMRARMDTMDAVVCMWISV